MASWKYTLDSELAQGLADGAAPLFGFGFHLAARRLRAWRAARRSDAEPAGRSCRESSTEP